MNNKMAINMYLSTNESKNKLCKQEEQRQNHGYGKHFDGCQMGGVRCRRMGKEVRRFRCTNRSYRIIRGSLDWCGSVGWALSCEQKGRQFDFESGHMPWLHARSLVGGVRPMDVFLVH